MFHQRRELTGLPPQSFLDLLAAGEVFERCGRLSRRGVKKEPVSWAGQIPPRPGSDHNSTVTVAAERVDGEPKCSASEGVFDRRGFLVSVARAQPRFQLQADLLDLVSRCRAAPRAGDFNGSLAVVAA
jgi:hypothetical protein